jgi:hypothetical protein
MSRCIGCQVTLGDKQKFCHECGIPNNAINTNTATPLVVKVICICGTPFENATSKFCTQCGKPRPDAVAAGASTQPITSSNGSATNGNHSNGNGSDAKLRSSPIVGRFIIAISTISTLRFDHHFGLLMIANRSNSTIINLNNDKY